MRLTDVWPHLQQVMEIGTGPGSSDFLTALRRLPGDIEVVVDKGDESDRAGVAFQIGDKYKIRLWKNKRGALFVALVDENRRITNLNVETRRMAEAARLLATLQTTDFDAVAVVEAGVAAAS